MGKAAKAVIATSIALELAGSALEVYNSGDPLNEVGKQSWGIAGGLAGGALGATVGTVLLGAVGVTSAPLLLGAGALVSVAGWVAGENYMEYAYDNILPDVLNAAANGTLTAVEIVDIAFDKANEFADDLWESTGEVAADFFDQIADGAASLGDDINQLADDYDWALDNPQ